jgi:hypothetical protein
VNAAHTHNSWYMKMSTGVLLCADRKSAEISSRLRPAAALIEGGEAKVAEPEEEAFERDVLEGEEDVCNDEEEDKGDGE